MCVCVCVCVCVDMIRNLFNNVNIYLSKYQLYKKYNTFSNKFRMQTPAIQKLFCFLMFTQSLFNTFPF